MWKNLLQVSSCSFFLISLFQTAVVDALNSVSLVGETEDLLGISRIENRLQDEPDSSFFINSISKNGTEVSEYIGKFDSEGRLIWSRSYLAPLSEVILLFDDAKTSHWLPAEVRHAAKEKISLLCPTAIHAEDGEYIQYCINSSNGEISGTGYFTSTVDDDAFIKTYSIPVFERHISIPQQMKFVNYPVSSFQRAQLEIQPRIFSILSSQKGLHLMKTTASSDIIWSIFLKDSSQSSEPAVTHSRVVLDSRGEVYTIITSSLQKRSSYNTIIRVNSNGKIIDLAQLGTTSMGEEKYNFAEVLVASVYLANGNVDHEPVSHQRVSGLKLSAYSDLPKRILLKRAMTAVGPEFAEDSAKESEPKARGHEDADVHFLALFGNGLNTHLMGIFSLSEPKSSEAISQPDRSDSSIDSAMNRQNNSTLQITSLAQFSLPTLDSFGTVKTFITKDSFYVLGSYNSFLASYPFVIKLSLSYDIIWAKYFMQFASTIQPLFFSEGDLFVQLGNVNYLLPEVAVMKINDEDGSIRGCISRDLPITTHPTPFVKLHTSGASSILIDSSRIERVASKDIHVSKIPVKRKPTVCFSEHGGN